MVKSVLTTVNLLVLLVLMILNVHLLEVTMFVQFCKDSLIYTLLVLPVFTKVLKRYGLMVGYTYQILLMLHMVQFQRVLVHMIWTVMINITSINRDLPREEISAVVLSISLMELLKMLSISHRLLCVYLKVKILDRMVWILNSIKLRNTDTRLLAMSH
jgi:hypothetical protein